MFSPTPHHCDSPVKPICIMIYRLLIWHHKFKFLMHKLMLYLSLFIKFLMYKLMLSLFIYLYNKYNISSFYSKYRWTLWHWVLHFTIGSWWLQSTPHKTSRAHESSYNDNDNTYFINNRLTIGRYIIMNIYSKIYIYI